MVSLAIKINKPEAYQQPYTGFNQSIWVSNVFKMYMANLGGMITKSAICFVCPCVYLVAKKILDKISYQVSRRDGGLNFMEMCDEVETCW